MSGHNVCTCALCKRGLELQRAAERAKEQAEADAYYAELKARLDERAPA